MFKKTRSILTIVAITLFMVACGGDGPATVPPPTDPNQLEFRVTTQDRLELKVTGTGADLAARQMDAAKQVATATKPDTTDYRDLLTREGMKMVIVDPSKNHIVNIFAFLTPTGYTYKVQVDSP